MKLNLGSGIKRLEGFVNVDCNEKSNPDVLWDLERHPYPFDDNSVAYIIMSHIYEHIHDVIGMMKELYRICQDGAIIEILAPYYTWRGAYSDPTHVRVVTKDSFVFYDATAKKMDGSPMADGEYDFETIESYPIVNDDWEIQQAYFKLVVHKPPRKNVIANSPNPQL